MNFKGKEYFKKFENIPEKMKMYPIMSNLVIFKKTFKNSKKHLKEKKLKK